MSATKHFFIQHNTVFRVAFLILIFFLFAYRPVNDPDFGWHVRVGQIEVETRAVPKYDIFSWTMPEYPWVGQEYLSDAIYYVLYRFGNGTLLLSLLYILLGFLIFVLLLPRLCGCSDWEDRMLIGLSAFFVSRPFFGVRSQVLGWLGFLLVWFLWKKYQETSKKKWLLVYPLLFLAWANMHASFPIGFVLLGILMFFDIMDAFPNASLASFVSLRTWFFEQKEKLLFFASVVAVSLTATLVNPFGYRMYVDIVHAVTNQFNRGFIAEWTPAVINSQNLVVFFVYLFSFLFIVFNQIGRISLGGENKILSTEEESFSFRDTTLLILFLGAALSSQRLVPFFVLVSLPILYQRISSNKLILPALAFVLAGSIFFGGTSFSRQKGNFPLNDAIYETPRATIDLPYWGNQKYFFADVPVGAFDYIKKYTMPDRVFNDYTWGGSLVWELPQIKTFIDGRMPFWVMGEKNIFRDYIIIESARPGWHEKIQEYGINWFLVRPNSAIAAALRLVPQEWENRYEDTGSVIFVKKGL